MKNVIKNILLISILTLVDVTSVRAQYYSVNFDYATIAAMTAGFATEAGTELLHRENTSKIAESYSYSEVATAGIFASKLLDRNALKSTSGFGDPDENYYYRKIYRLVANKIIPRTVKVTEKLVRDPSTAIFWGSHLLKVMADTKSLCNQFSAVCTNSTLKFEDINFLEFAGTLQNVFNLQNLTDFVSFFDNIANIGQNFSTENIENEFDNLQNLAVGLAGAGSEGVTDLFNGSAFSGTFMDNVGKIVQKVDSCSTMWNQLQGNASSVIGQLTSGDMEDISALFTTSNGGDNSWISHYMTNSDAQYYKQRVYIYHTDSGSETLCKYEPPTDNDAILYGDHYTRFPTDQQYYYMSDAERNQALQNSYNHAGWSQAMVDEKNRSNDGYSYYMSTWSHGYSCYHTRNGNFNGYYAYSIAYSVTVTRSWYNTETYYEDVYDSYSMDWNTFMNVMNAKLQEANQNDQGKVFRIGYGNKQYYTASNERKLKGATQANFVTQCESNGKIIDGSFQYKCSGCGGSPNEHTKRCSMATSLQNNDFDYEEINRAITETEQQMTQKQSQINAYNTRNREILNQLGKLSISSDEYRQLQTEYQTNRNEINALQAEYDALNENLQGYKNAKQEAIDFENSQTDSHSRIPSVMHELQKNFSLEWLEEGHWEGYTYVRKANMKGLKSVVTFRAKVSIARGPKYFLFIKIHRAIVRVEYELTAEYSDSEVVESMQLDPNSDAEQQNRIVNDRLQQLQQLYPDCAVSVEFEYAPGQHEDEDDDDSVHLLWASDRLDIARDICHRLEAIYVDLVVLDKFLSYKYSILDWLKDATLNQLNADRGRRLSIAERCQRRWMHNGGSDLYLREEEDDNYEVD